MKVKLHLLRKRYKELISVDVTLDRNRCSFSFKIQSLHFVPSEKNNNKKKHRFIWVCLFPVLSGNEKQNKNIIKQYFILTASFHLQSNIYFTHSSLDKGELILKASYVCASIPFPVFQLELVSHYEQPVKSHACSKFQPAFLNKKRRVTYH